MAKLFTVGYQGLEVGQLKAKLEAAAAGLVDIRFTPFSRDSQWNRRSLERLLGNRYYWVQAFGNPNYKGGPITLADPDAGVATVRALAEQHGALVLLCVCRDWRTCHRLTVSQLLEERLGCGQAMHWRPGDMRAMTSLPIRVPGV